MQFQTVKQRSIFFLSLSFQCLFSAWSYGLLFQSVLPREGNSQHSRELKQQTHFDVRSAIVFVGVIFVSLGGLFYICSIGPTECVLLELGVVYVGSGWEGVERAGVSPDKQIFLFFSFFFDGLMNSVLGVD